MDSDEPKTKQSAGGETDLGGVLVKIASLMERNQTALEALQTRVERVEASADTLEPALVELQDLGRSLTAAVTSGQRVAHEQATILAKLLNNRAPRAPKRELN
jgi:uncharacterized protein YoxC